MCGQMKEVEDEPAGGGTTKGGSKAKISRKVRDAGNWGEDYGGYTSIFLGGCGSSSAVPQLLLVEGTFVYL